MSSLNDQLNSFRAKVRNAPVLGKRIIPQAPQSETSGGTGPDGGDAAKRRKTAVVYSQPASAGTGLHRSTQLVHAIEYLRKHEQPILFADLENYLSSPVQPLIPMLQQHRNVRVNLKDQTATYVSKFDIYSANDLLRFLKTQKSYQGTSVKDLKDGWSQAIPTINRLEQENKLLVLRNKKDNTPRLIWPNEAGPLSTIDQVFVDLWRTAKVPSSSDLPGTLERVGLKPSSVDPSSIKQIKKAPEKKTKKNHRGKITNTHLRGVLKDYST